jgi:ribonuclease P protein component
VFALPNETGEHRLGLSIGRRLGNAVTRHRLKRRLREAFRLNRHELPGTYDFVVVARPHSPMKTAGYAELLLDCATRLDREWTKRARRADAKDADAAERGPS